MGLPQQISSVCLVAVEAEKVAPLEVGGASFGDEVTDVALVHTETPGDSGEVQEWLGLSGRGSRGSARMRAVLRTRCSTLKVKYSTGT